MSGDSAIALLRTVGKKPAQTDSTDNYELKLGLGFHVRQKKNKYSMFHETTEKEFAVKLLISIKRGDKYIFLSSMKQFYQYLSTEGLVMSWELTKYVAQLDKEHLITDIVRLQRPLLSALELKDVHDQPYLFSKKIKSVEFDNLLDSLQSDIENEIYFIIDLTQDKTTNTSSQQLSNRSSVVKKIKSQAMEDYELDLSSFDGALDKNMLKFSLKQLQSLRSRLRDKNQANQKQRIPKHTIRRLGDSGKNSSLPWHEKFAGPLDDIKTEQDDLLTSYRWNITQGAMVKVEDLKLPLYPYQDYGVNYAWSCLKRNMGVIIADDMGLGKTIQAIALVNRVLNLKTVDKSHKALIIVPKSVMNNWEKEINSCCAFRVVFYLGKNTDQDKFNNSRVILSTYDACVNDLKRLTSNKLRKLLKRAEETTKLSANRAQITNKYASSVLHNLINTGYINDNGMVNPLLVDNANLEAFIRQGICFPGHAEYLLEQLCKLKEAQRTLINKQSICIVILDEAHRIKNLQTLRTQTLRTIAAPYRVVLTGTPIHNSLEDIFSLMSFLNPGMLGTLEQFKKEYTKQFQKAISQTERWVTQHKSRGQNKDFSSVHDLPEVKLTMQNFTKLRDAIAPFIIRREKNDETILEQLRTCGGRNVSSLTCETDKIQYSLCHEQRILIKHIYEKEKKSISDAIGAANLFNNETRATKKGFETLVKIQQILDHPLLLREKTIKDFIEACNEDSDDKYAKEVQAALLKIMNSDSAVHSGKLDALVKKVGNIILNENEKVIISVRFIKIAKLMQQRFRNEFNQEAHYLYGDCSIEQRQRMIDIFSGKLSALDQKGLKDILTVIAKEFFHQKLKGWLKDKGVINAEGKLLKTHSEFENLVFNSEFERYKTPLKNSLYFYKNDMNKSLKNLRKEFIREGMECETEILSAVKKLSSSQQVNTDSIYESVPENYRPVINRIISLFASKIFILNYKAGGEGINLQVANKVIIFDPSYNPADNAQVIARAHRIGQTRPVSVFYMETEDDLTERKMLQKAELKSWLADVILSPHVDDNKLFTLIYDRLLEDNDIIAEIEQLQEKNLEDDRIASMSVAENLDGNQQTFIPNMMEITDYMNVESRQDKSTIVPRPEKQPILGVDNSAQSNSYWRNSNPSLFFSPQLSPPLAQHDSIEPNFLGYNDDPLAELFPDVTSNHFFGKDMMQYW